MAFTRGDLIKASDIGATANDTTSGSLFARLNKVRATHLAAYQAIGQTNANLTTAFTTNPVSAGNLITNSWITLMKDYFTRLATSKYVGTDYGTTLAAPAAGALITAADLEAFSSAIATVEGLRCTNSSYNSSQYGYNSSYNSSQYSYNSSYNAGQHAYNSSYNSSQFNVYCSSHRAAKYAILG